MAHQPKSWSLGLPISDPVFPQSLDPEPAAARTFPFLWFPLPPFGMVLLTFLSTDRQSVIYRTPQSCPLEEISVSWITLEVWQKPLRNNISKNRKDAPLWAAGTPSLRSRPFCSASECVRCSVSEQPQLIFFLAYPNWMRCYHPTIKVRNPRQVPCTRFLLLKPRSRCSIPGLPDTRPEWYRLEVPGISPDMLGLVWCTLLNRW